MRKWVDKYLADIASINKKIRLIIADVGDFPEFANKHKDKFINAGVSESNAIGLAAGLASEGYQVYVYGVSSFFLYRAFEQLKYSVAYWNKNVTFIGVGFGWKYYNIGIGHFCPDDILLTQTLPNFEIHTPYKLSQLKDILLNESLNPRYIRLTANIVDESYVDFFNDGYDFIIVTYGELVKNSIEVINYFQRNNKNIGLIALQTLDSNYIRERLFSCRKTSLIVIEDQYGQGGLLPILRELGAKVVLNFGLPILPDKVAMSREELVQMYGLDVKTLCDSISNKLF